MTAKEKILDSLKHGALTDAEIAVAINIPAPSVRRARGELLVAKQIEAHVTHADGSMSWRLPQPVEDKPRPKVEPKWVSPEIKRPPEVRPAPGNIVNF